MDDEKIKIELKGCISRIDSIRLRAETEYIDSCRVTAFMQESAMEQLLELAPSDLQKELAPVLYSLLFYKKAGLELKPRGHGGERNLAQKTAVLVLGWQDAIEMEFDTSALPKILRIRFRAVP
jgi:hypothetical protein